MTTCCTIWPAETNQSNQPSVLHPFHCKRNLEVSDSLMTDSKGMENRGVCLNGP